MTIVDVFEQPYNSLHFNKNAMDLACIEKKHTDLTNEVNVKLKEYCQFQLRVIR